jgi:hypothetical protein
MTPQPVPPDVRKDIASTMEALDKLDTLLANLATQRKAALDDFLRKFSTDIVGQPGVVDTKFADDELKTFATWDTGDQQAGKRILDLTRIREGLDERIRNFERFYRDDAIEVLKLRIKTLVAQRKLVEFDERGLDHRIHVLEVELARLQRSGHYTGRDDSEETEQTGRKSAKRATRSAATKRRARAKR